MLFQSRGCRINKNKEYSKFLQAYCDAYHARDLAEIQLGTPTVHLFNGTLIDWCAKKNMKRQEAVLMQKQEQCIQEC